MGVRSAFRDYTEYREQVREQRIAERTNYRQDLSLVSAAAGILALEESLGKELLTGEARIALRGWASAQPDALTGAQEFIDHPFEWSVTPEGYGMLEERIRSSLQAGSIALHTSVELLSVVPAVE